MKSLFHYTSINTLALILRSKSIKFGRLDLVNDPKEGMVRDFNNLSPYIFISSWTSNKEENFALWNMYTNKMRGVRIEIELPIFNSYKIEENDDFLFSKDEFINNEKGYFIYGGVNSPQEIIYTNEEKLLQPSIRNSNGLHIVDVGKYKQKIWEFEQEFRYRLEIFPIDNKVQSNYFPHKYEHLLDNQTPPSINSYFVKINERAFKNMKLVIGPKMKLGDIEIIESLINKFNPNAIISESKLTGHIR
jgi:hypothetical protein